MVELLVMRHAKSAWDTGHADFDRPLAARGHCDAIRMARWLVDHDLVPDRVIASSAERARHTAAIVVERCSADPASLELHDSLYHADARRWVALLRGQSVERVMIVGHNPALDDLVDDLASGSAERSANGKLMTTAAIAHLRIDSWAGIDPTNARLETLVRPRDL